MERMFEIEDGWGRLIQREREWQKTNRRLGKETKEVNWRRGREGWISAPLFIDPTWNESNMWEVWGRDRDESGSNRKGRDEVNITLQIWIFEKQ